MRRHRCSGTMSDEAHWSRIMPIHDWSRLPGGAFADFHLEWISSIKLVLNKHVLPPGYYAAAEQTAGEFTADVLALARTVRDGVYDAFDVPL